ncbi:DUF4248 domain-containing protein [uncultured Bacteroides sp.]|uniref:DUF4248 domain-containing protein n=1 Tax=uncultured Bacteroides sp. TaxID=162156 RepID=UPI002AAA8730|nr:DUF4248 domain-containing protein [uncultured Bacteroides sp.]
MTRNELAELYMPNVQLATARRTLHRWIARNAALQSELAATGYSIRAAILTPVQVELIFRYLGVP